MKKSRIVMISRRFWPLVGGAERAMAGLASQFHAEGHDVQFLTAQWEPNWPSELVHREVSVIRLNHPKTKGWGTFRYMTHLKNWLKENRTEYDAVLVSMLKHDAYAATKTAHRFGIPVVIRAEGSGPTGDCEFHRTARFGARLKSGCQKADAIIAPSQRVYDELLESDFEKDRVRFVANGVEVMDSSIDKTDARLSLADAHPILQVDTGEPLVIYTGRLDKEKGLFDLIDAWKIVGQTFPNGRLWLIGEGPDGRAIWERIRNQQLSYQVILPGSFDEVTDLLAAADAFVLPSYQEGMSLSLLEAMAANVPVVATDIPGNRDLIQEDNGLLCKTHDPESLASAILDALKRQAPAKQRAENARRFVSENYSLEKMAQEHLEIIDQQIFANKR